MQRGHQNARSSPQVKPCKAAENRRPAPAPGCIGVRRSDTNKAQAACPPPGKLRVAGEHLHCLRSLLVQVAGWDWLQGLRPSHPRCALASRLAASRASVLACFLQPGARGGPASGRGCCTAEGSSCWHPWWRRQQGAAVRDAIWRPESERRGSVRACGRRAPVCVRDCGARGSARGAQV